ncbi:DUF5046 domain-containing protein [Faecalibacterium prausnitzii]|uniref:DUF5046 domain-containing protein n=1 Tax=Faecalibacterium prausnitzii TaxID=853 RepID=UPI0029076806|nr:DUF5046 domain-containing protein [Faecalibacterium prausnitzii]
MKRFSSQMNRIGCAAVCVSLSLALGCGCAVLPPASSKPASSASVPTDSSGKPLYDASRLDDGQLRALYGYDRAGSSTAILCGSKVLYQSARSENVTLLQDVVTGETNYWFRSWSDPTGRGGRRSALYDKDGTEVLAFDGEQSATLQNGLLVLQESRLIDGGYVPESGYGTCQVIDLATGAALPVPEGAYSCTLCGDKLVFSCYARPEGLDDYDWDTDYRQNSWVVVQEKDGTPVYRAEAASAYRLFYDSDTLSDWVKLDVATGEETTDQILYNTQTGEQYTGFLQVYPGGLASFSTSDGRYELRDMTTEDRGLIAAFDEQPSQYFPGYVVTWHRGEDHGYDLYDLETGAKTPLYDVDATDSTIAVYALDGSLRVYSKDNGKLLTETTVEPVEHQQRVRMSNCGSGYVWLKLQDNDRYETTATRLYGPQGLVSDLTALQGKYSYVNYLTTDPDGRPMFYGSRAAAGSAYGNVCDVLDENGNVVLSGLGSCYSYYANSLNHLPDHVFVAQRGFYYGWMDTDGNWLFCQSIFSSINSDDELGY